MFWNSEKSWSRKAVMFGSVFLESSVLTFLAKIHFLSLNGLWGISSRIPLQTPLGHHSSSKWFIMYQQMRSVSWIFRRSLPGAGQFCGVAWFFFGGSCSILWPKNHIVSIDTRQHNHHRRAESAGTAWFPLIIWSRPMSKGKRGWWGSICVWVVG